MKRLGAVLAFFTIPNSALLANFSLLSSNPTWIASYPSVATVFFCNTTLASASTTVTGINKPSVVKT